MKLGGYTAGRQVNVPVWLAVVLGIIWGVGVVRDFDGADAYEAVDGAEIYELYVDREMRLLDGAETAPGWVRWAFGVHARTGKMEDLLRTLDEGDRVGAIGVEGQRARAVLNWVAGSKDEARVALHAGRENGNALSGVLRPLMRGEPVPDGPRRRLRDLVASGEAQAWDVWGLRLASVPADGHDGGVFGVYDRESRRLVWRAFAAMLGIFVMVAAGLACLPFVLRRWRAHPAPALHRVVKLWSVPLVLTVFFATEFIGGIAADLFLVLLSLVDEWPIALELGYDTLWRVMPAGLAALFLFNRPTHLARVFGLTRPGHWMAALAVLAALWSWDWVTYPFTGGEEILPVQPTDFIDYADPTWGELGLAFVSSCVTAPLVEEIMFRGLLFLGLRRAIGPWGALAVSSFLFGVIHWQYGVFGVLSVMLLGAGNALLVWRTGSLFPAVLVHAAYNFLITVMVLVVYQLPL